MGFVKGVASFFPGKRDKRRRGEEAREGAVTRRDVLHRVQAAVATRNFKGVAAADGEEESVKQNVSKRHTGKSGSKLRSSCSSSALSEGCNVAAAPRREEEESRETPKFSGGRPVSARAFISPSPLNPS